MTCEDRMVERLKELGHIPEVTVGMDVIKKAVVKSKLAKDGKQALAASDYFIDNVHNPMYRRFMEVV